MRVKCGPYTVFSYCASLDALRLVSEKIYLYVYIVRMYNLALEFGINLGEF
jgi:hypothetical protein